MRLAFLAISSLFTPCSVSMMAFAFGLSGTAAAQAVEEENLLEAPKRSEGKVSGSALDGMLGTVGSVSMDTDRVDVALYSAPDGQPYPAVQVTIGEHEYLFKLETSISGVFVGPRVAKDQELNVRTGNKKFINLTGEGNQFRVGGERKYAELNELKIGGLVMHDLVVATTEWDPSQQEKDWGAPAQSGTAFDGAIGLQALPDDVSWAIRPSAAQVSFARGEAVSGLATAGTTVPYTESGSYYYKYGTRKGWEASQSLIVEMNIGGVTHPTVLASTIYGAFYVTLEPNLAEVNNRQSDVFTRYHDVSVADSSLGLTWFAEFTDLPESPGFYKAVVGNRFLGGYDVAVDRGASTVTLTKASNPTWHDPREFLLVEALNAVEPEEETTEVTEADTATETEVGTDQDLLTESSEPKLPGSPEAWKTLKELYVSTGDLTKALEAMNKVIEFEPRDCMSWFTLGRLQVRAGNIAAAITSFETASKGYHDWYGLPLDERKELEKDRKKMGEEEKEASPHYPADDSCHRADGHLAAATFSAGDLLTVEKLYRDRFDLDSGLALVTANAMITKGEYSRAQEPLRQALKMGGSKSDARLALAMVYANTGDWDQASTLFDRSLGTSRNTQAVKVWLDAYKSAQGHAPAAKAAADFAQQHPESRAAQYGLAYVMADTEDGADKARAHSKGKSVFADALARNPRLGSTWAVYSRWLNLWGEVAAAEDAATKALALAPGKATSLIAMAEVYAAKEEFARAKQYTLKAAQADPFHPGFAHLVNTLSE
jgi:tetratricopeptide (TPR) repeat protein